MLSKQAFNALLKTLEEPPSHVKFIFATTEIRKVPVTILSRCQRFDLKRIDVPTLTTHFSNICKKENVKADDEALDLIAQAADGSVRDGLSLLDQAMALGASGEVKGDDVAAMLGATDRVKILDLIETALSAKAAESMTIMHDLYNMGTDPRAVIQDMMDMVHGLSLLATNADTSVESLPHAAMDQAKAMASKLTVPQLQKSWQILLKGLGEMNTAPNPQKAAEMIILRLSFAADLPDPTDILKKIKDGKINVGAMPAAQNGHDAGGDRPQLKAIAGGGAVAQAAPQSQSIESPDTLQAVIKLFEDNGEVLTAAHLYQDVAVTKIHANVLEFVAYKNAPTDLAGRVRTCLKNWTGDNWMVSVVSNADGALSLADVDRQTKDAETNEIKSHANIKAVLNAFPDAEIVGVFEDEDS